MSELDGIGRVIPGDRSRDRPQKRPPQKKFEEDELLEEQTEPGSEEESEDTPGTGPRKDRKGREIAPPAKHEEGQIIDILA